MNPHGVIRALLFGALFLFTLHDADAQSQTVRFDLRVECTFQFGHYLDDSEARTVANNEPMRWRFTALNESLATWESGGTSGQAASWRQTGEEGVSLFIPAGNGAHLISIWRNGIGFWTKHNAIGTSIATQQYRGTCRN